MAIGSPNFHRLHRIDSIPSILGQAIFVRNLFSRATVRSTDCCRSLRRKIQQIVRRPRTVRLVACDRLGHSSLHAYFMRLLQSELHSIFLREIRVHPSEGGSRWRPVKKLERRVDSEKWLAHGVCELEFSAEANGRWLAQLFLQHLVIST